MPVILVRRIRSQARRNAARKARLLRAELKAETRKHGKEVRAEFEQVVSDWSSRNRPKFVLKQEINEREIRVEVRPYRRRKASRVFSWVDQGTRPHTIRPRRRRPKSRTRKRLAFRLDYKPHTLPIAKAHVGDGQKHGDWVTPMVVRHPGIKPRLFSQEIERKTKPRFRARIESIFRRFARRRA